jgi:hypothetical protein
VHVGVAKLLNHYAQIDTGSADKAVAALPNKPVALAATERNKFNAATAVWSRIGADGSMDKTGVPFIYRKAEVTVEGKKEVRLFAYSGATGYHVLETSGAWKSLQKNDALIASAHIADAEEKFNALPNAPTQIAASERAKFNAALSVWGTIGEAGSVDSKKVPFIYRKADVRTANGGMETKLFAYTAGSGYNVMDTTGTWKKLTPTDPLIAQAGIGDGATVFAALKKKEVKNVA